MSLAAAQRKTERKMVPATRMAGEQSRVSDQISPIYASILQRKPACACGGECPRCHANSYGVQPKLRVSTPGEKYEVEADRVADQVMRMPESRVQRQPVEEEKEENTVQTKPLANTISVFVQRQVEPEEEEETQTKPLEGTLLRQAEVDEEDEEDEEGTIPYAKAATGHTSTVSPTTHARINSLKAGGQPLSKQTRGFFESRIGHDFSSVRVHTNSQASDAAKSVNARAFTLGKDIVFGAGQYAPQTHEGRHLLAHELTHVVQQEGTSVTIQRIKPYSSRRSFQEYKKQKTGLNRILRRIRRTRSAKRRKQRQIVLMVKIYRKVLGYNPFKVIDIKKLRKSKKVIRGQYQYLITTGPDAKTEWVDPVNKSKGIKVTFDEGLFKDPLESIIVTALHEGVHAQHLLSGVPYQTFARKGAASNYQNAIRTLSELDAYYAVLRSPFFAKLTPARQKELRKHLGDAGMELKTALNRISAKWRYSAYQSQIVKMLPKFKMLKKWFINNPLPWKKQTP